jgi:uncharacterized membrane protein
MSVGGIKLWPALLAGIFCAVYAALAHYSSASADAGTWAILLAAAPMAVIGFGIARRSAWGITLWIAALAALAWLWPHLQHHVGWMYFLQHLGVNLALGLLFGRSLAGGKQPLCTTFATFVHPVMNSGLLTYTRQVTQAWALFFFAMASVSVLLFFLAPLEIWSVFANILTLPLVALMFVVENLVRRRTLPPEDQLGLFAAVHAYRLAMRPENRGNLCKTAIAPESSPLP